MRTIITSLLLLALVVVVPTGATFAQDGSTELPADKQQQLDALPDDLTRIETLQGWIRSSPNDPRLYFHLGNSNFDAGKLADAANAYEKAIELDPQMLGAHVNLGSVYDEMGRLDDAITAYRAALEIEPNEDRTLCNMGNVYFKKRQYERAMEQFQMALEANPQSQLAHYNMAILFADSGIYDEAIREWEKVVAIDPASDLGVRSAQNVETIKAYLSSETPDLGGR